MAIRLNLRITPVDDVHEDSSETLGDFHKYSLLCKQRLWEQFTTCGKSPKKYGHSAGMTIINK